MSQRNGRQAEELARVMRLAKVQVVADVAVMRTNGILHTSESWLLDEWKSFRGSGKMASGKLKRFLDTCVETGGNVPGLGRMSGHGNELEVFYTYCWQPDEEEPPSQELLKRVAHCIELSARGRNNVTLEGLAKEKSLGPILSALLEHYEDDCDTLATWLTACDDLLEIKPTARWHHVESLADEHDAFVGAYLPADFHEHARELVEVMWDQDVQAIGDSELMGDSGPVLATQSWLFDAWAEYRGAGSGRLSDFLNDCVAGDEEMLGLRRLRSTSGSGSRFYVACYELRGDEPDSALLSATADCIESLAVVRGGGIAVDELLLEPGVGAVFRDLLASMNGDTKRLVDILPWTQPAHLETYVGVQVLMFELPKPTSAPDQDRDNPQDGAPQEQPQFTLPEEFGYELIRVLKSSGQYVMQYEEIEDISPNYIITITNSWLSLALNRRRNEAVPSSKLVVSFVDACISSVPDDTLLKSFVFEGKHYVYCYDRSFGPPSEKLFSLIAACAWRLSVDTKKSVSLNDMTSNPVFGDLATEMFASCGTIDRFATRLYACQKWNAPKNAHKKKRRLWLYVYTDDLDIYVAAVGAGDSLVYKYPAEPFERGNIPAPDLSTYAYVGEATKFHKVEQPPMETRMGTDAASSREQRNGFTFGSQYGYELIRVLKSSQQYIMSYDELLRAGPGAIMVKTDSWLPTKYQEYQSVKSSGSDEIKPFLDKCISSVSRKTGLRKLVVDGNNYAYCYDRSFGPPSKRLFSVLAAHAWRIATHENRSVRLDDLLGDHVCGRPATEALAALGSLEQFATNLLDGCNGSKRLKVTVYRHDLDICVASKNEILYAEDQVSTTTEPTAKPAAAPSAKPAAKPEPTKTVRPKTADIPPAPTTKGGLIKAIAVCAVILVIILALVGVMPKGEGQSAPVKAPESISTADIQTVLAEQEIVGSWTLEKMMVDGQWWTKQDFDEKWPEGWPDGLPASLTINADHTHTFVRDQVTYKGSWVIYELTPDTSYRLYPDHDTTGDYCWPTSIVDGHLIILNDTMWIKQE